MQAAEQMDGHLLVTWGPALWAVVRLGGCSSTGTSEMAPMPHPAGALMTPLRQEAKSHMIHPTAGIRAAARCVSASQLYKDVLLWYRYRAGKTEWQL